MPLSPPLRPLAPGVRASTPRAAPQPRPGLPPRGHLRGGDLLHPPGLVVRGSRRARASGHPPLAFNCRRAAGRAPASAGDVRAAPQSAAPSGRTSKWCASRNAARRSDGGGLRLLDEPRVHAPGAQQQPAGRPRDSGAAAAAATRSTGSGVVLIVLPSTLRRSAAPPPRGRGCSSPGTSASSAACSRLALIGAHAADLVDQKRVVAARLRLGRGYPPSRSARCAPSPRS